MRTRSRVRRPTRRRAMSRKRSTMTRKVRSRKSFKSKGLTGLVLKKPNNTFYETSIVGVPINTAQPSLAVGRCISISNNGTFYDTRLGPDIFLSGLRIRCFFQNKQLRPQTVHVAMIRPKEGQTPPNQEDFERAFFKRMGVGSGGPSLTGMDFDEPTTGIEYATLPLNTARWNVVWHTRFKLGVTSTTGGYSSGELKNYRTLYRYIKINRHIHFPDKDNNYPSNDQEIYLCVWGCPLDYDKSLEPNPVEDALKISTNCVMVYRRTNGGV